MSISSKKRAPAPAAVIVHSCLQARVAAQAAARAGRDLDLRSGPGAGAYAGAGWWAALVAEIQAAFPTLAVRGILDCGDDAGAAMAAMRAGVAHLAVAGRPALRRRIADLAAQSRAEIVDIAAPALDLGKLAPGADMDRACREWLDAIR